MFFCRPGEHGDTGGEHGDTGGEHGDTGGEHGTLQTFYDICILRLSFKFRDKFKIYDFLFPLLLDFGKTIWHILSSYKKSINTIDELVIRHFLENVCYFLISVS